MKVITILNRCALGLQQQALSPIEPAVGWPVVYELGRLTSNLFQMYHWRACNTFSNIFTACFKMSVISNHLTAAKLESISAAVNYNRR